MTTVSGRFFAMTAGALHDAKSRRSREDAKNCNGLAAKAPKRPFLRAAPWALSRPMLRLSFAQGSCRGAQAE
jgi:hypothetical protein